MLRKGGSRLFDPLSLCDAGLEPGQPHLLDVEVSHYHSVTMLLALFCSTLFYHEINMKMHKLWPQVRE